MKVLLNIGGKEFNFAPLPEKINVSFLKANGLVKLYKKIWPNPILYLD